MAIRRLQAKQWKTVLSQKASTEDVVVLKGLDCETKQEGHEDDRTLLFSISSARVDRDNDTLSVDGWELDNFAKAPAMLWAHDGSKPMIATPTRTWVEGGLLKSTATFLPPDLSDHDHVKFSDMIYQMYKRGFMRALSVGFKPISYEVNEERGGFYPLDYTSQELLEYSAVPVPSNVDALYEARSAGIDLGPMQDWAKSVIEDDSSTGIWIPKAQAEALHKALDTSVSLQVPDQIETEKTPEPSDAAPPPVVSGGSDATEKDTKPLTPEQLDEAIKHFDDLQEAANKEFANIVVRTTSAIKCVAHVIKAGRILPDEVKSEYLAALKLLEPKADPEPEPDYITFDFSTPDKSAAEVPEDDGMFEMTPEVMKEIGAAIGAIAKDAAEQAVIRLTGRLP